MVMYQIILLLHILAAIVAVGAATVTDYLHIAGLRKKRLERQLKNIYPRLSDMINFSLILIISTGVILLLQKPSFVSSHLFILKMVLVAVVSINGIYLQKIVSPHLDLCVMKGTKYCVPSVLYSSAISGSISIVTWYAIVILAFTKTLGYTLTQFVIGYGTVLALAITTALIIESRAREWR